ncbi:MAG: redoxin domain-containing protein [Flavobacteriales bacterium]|nr:MAG: redoxin domain-containing protein [Flavobacteriales bacterium]
MTSSQLDHLTLKDLGGNTTALGLLEGDSATLYITLDPECPMTLGYAPLLDSLEEALPDGVAMVGLYPAPFIDRDSAAAFARKHDLDFPQVMDPGCHLANALRARVTPEVFLVALSGEVLYRGALDNSAVREGRKRAANEHYLRDALSAFAGGKPQPHTEVRAFGCIVECDNTGTE